MAVTKLELKQAAEELNGRLAASGRNSPVAKRVQRAIAKCAGEPERLKSKELALLLEDKQIAELSPEFAAKLRGYVWINMPDNLNYLVRKHRAALQVWLALTEVQPEARRRIFATYPELLKNCLADPSVLAQMRAELGTFLLKPGEDKPLTCLCLEEDPGFLFEVFKHAALLNKDQIRAKQQPYFNSYDVELILDNSRSQLTLELEGLQRCQNWAKPGPMRRLHRVLTYLLGESLFTWMGWTLPPQVQVKHALDAAIRKKTEPASVRTGAKPDSANASSVSGAKDDHVVFERPREKAEHLVRGLAREEVLRRQALEQAEAERVRAGQARREEKKLPVGFTRVTKPHNASVATKRANEFVLGQARVVMSSRVASYISSSLARRLNPMSREEKRGYMGWLVEKMRELLRASVSAPVTTSSLIGPSEVEVATVISTSDSLPLPDQRLFVSREKRGGVSSALVPSSYGQVNALTQGPLALVVANDIVSHDEEAGLLQGGGDDDVLDDDVLRAASDFVAISFVHAEDGTEETLYVSKEYAVQAAALSQAGNVCGARLLADLTQGSPVRRSGRGYGSDLDEVLSPESLANKSSMPQPGGCTDNVRAGGSFLDEELSPASRKAAARRSFFDDEVLSPGSRGQLSEALSPGSKGQLSEALSPGSGLKRSQSIDGLLDEDRRSRLSKV